MAGKKLYANVYVGDKMYEAGSTPSKDIADQITNEKAWTEPEDTAEELSGDSDPKALNKAVKAAQSDDK